MDARSILKYSLSIQDKDAKLNPPSSSWIQVFHKKYTNSIKLYEQKNSEKHMFRVNALQLQLMTNQTEIKMH